MIPAPLLLSPSRFARYGLIGLHLAAAGVACLLPMPWRAAALAAVILHGLWHCLRSTPEVISLQALPEGRVAVFMASGERLEAECLPSSRIVSKLIVLHLRHAAGRQDVLLWPDCAPAEILRQWRVWLRWGLPAVLRKMADHQVL
ncbi:hypothetical protein SAMN05660284_01247 [Formivibrio citricus]|uniref:Toxin CptA n=1 Tax=Formivibrio citricus TaxID=83765 RepID=A0A1I4Y722_9NEIS|nr:protein YgfX [Formivibrio citricus]SFN33841.1 hypothetical protein SAMN05660284_01247 [Formivibrio citricus]